MPLQVGSDLLSTKSQSISDMKVLVSIKSCISIEVQYLQLKSYER